MAHALIIYPAEYTIITKSHFGQFIRRVFSSVGTRFIDDRVCLAMNNFASGKKGNRKGMRGDHIQLICTLSVASFNIHCVAKSFLWKHIRRHMTGPICPKVISIETTYPWLSSEWKRQRINSDFLGGLIKYICALCLIADWRHIPVQLLENC